ncbi:MAG: FIST signal transduction protein, partial [Candidatus Aenigmatarchaeota archaeon]
ILGDDWMGCTSDSELNSILGFSRGTIEVLSLQSKYLHFSPVLIEKYRDNPKKKAMEATEKAVNEANVERSVHATSQYMRSTKKKFSNIIKNPPYFVLTYPSGLYNKDGESVLGLESEFIRGIQDSLGPHIPILGGSASPAVEDFLGGESRNYVFSNGDYSNTGAVICFVVSELYFSFGLKHGYEETNKNAIITKLSGKGRIIERLNDKPALEEYSNLTGFAKEKLEEDLLSYSIRKPLTVFDSSQNIYPKVSVNSERENCINSTFKFAEGQAVRIAGVDGEKTINALKGSVDEALEGRDFEPALILLSTCAMRRLLLQDKISEPVKRLEESYPSTPFFGFYTAGEIGGKRNEQAKFNNITSTNLVISDKLQTE